MGYPESNKRQLFYRFKDLSTPTFKDLYAVEVYANARWNDLITIRMYGAPELTVIQKCTLICELNKLTGFSYEEYELVEA